MLNFRALLKAILMMRRILNEYYEKQYPYRISPRRARKIFHNENNFTATILTYLFFYIVGIIFWGYLLQIDFLSGLTPKDPFLQQYLMIMVDSSADASSRLSALYEAALRCVMIIVNFLRSFF